MCEVYIHCEGVGYGGMLCVKMLHVNKNATVDYSTVCFEMSESLQYF